jgi:predicted DNA-binding WGR domain protein
LCCAGLIQTTAWRGSTCSNIECDLFGTVRLVRTWGRIGTRARELADVFETEEAAAEALEAFAAVKRRRGYLDL